MNSTLLTPRNPLIDREERLRQMLLGDLGDAQQALTVSFGSSLLSEEDEACLRAAAVLVNTVTKRHRS
jgi:hypothetical protein